jgi:hypothetical protein
MNDSERLALWQQWLDTITADVQDLLVKRHIFRRVGEIVMANLEIQQPGAFHEFLAGSYGAAAVLAVRRQVDDNSRAVSLLKLLVELRSRPDLVSRRRFVDLVQLRGTEAETANHQFDEIAGKAAARGETGLLRARGRWPTLGPPGAQPRLPTHRLRALCPVRRQLVRAQATSRGGAWTYYGCMYNHQRGPAACSNTLTVPMDRANGAFLE